MATGLVQAGRRVQVAEANYTSIHFLHSILKFLSSKNHSGGNHDTGLCSRPSDYGTGGVVRHVLAGNCVWQLTGGFLAAFQDGDMIGRYLPVFGSMTAFQDDSMVDRFLAKF